MGTPPQQPKSTDWTQVAMQGGSSLGLYPLRSCPLVTSGHGWPQWGQVNVLFQTTYHSFSITTSCLWRLAASFIAILTVNFIYISPCEKLKSYWCSLFRMIQTPSQRDRSCFLYNCSWNFQQSLAFCWSCGILVQTKIILAYSFRMSAYSEPIRTSGPRVPT